MILVTQKDLRDGCAQLHSTAEKTQLAQELITGTIDPVIYKNYCYQLWMIADAVESRIDFIPDLQRRHALVMDIAECPPGTVTACKSTIEYVNRIREFNNPQFPGKLKGHIYTNYLGWLYGGQLIAKNLSLPVNHLRFNNVKSCIEYVRSSHLNMIFDSDIEEAKQAFEYTIRIYDELYQLH